MPGYENIYFEKFFRIIEINDEQDLDINNLSDNEIEVLLEGIL